MTNSFENEHVMKSEILVKKITLINIRCKLRAIKECFSD